MDSKQLFELLCSVSASPPGILVRTLQDSKDPNINVCNSFVVAGPSADEILLSAVHTKVRSYIARNAKIGPWRTTAIDPATGQPLSVAYYLNASTNLLDKAIARECTLLMLRLLRGALQTLDLTDCTGPVFVVGPEMAGGVIVGQMASFWIEHEGITPVDFVYMRKQKKKSGTLQQLEGPNVATTRTANSPLACGIWVDDVLSTGTSMREGIDLLKSAYRIDVRAAIFLVDRSADRKAGGSRVVNLNSETMREVYCSAAFDLAEIDPLIPRNSSSEN